MRNSPTSSTALNSDNIHQEVLQDDDLSKNEGIKEVQGHNPESDNIFALSAGSRKGDLYCG